MSKREQSPSSEAGVVRGAGAVGLRTIWAGRALLALAVVGLLVVVLRNGFVCDDYYHSLKAAWNLVHGHGLLTNPGERVQAFTNPLWTLLLAAMPWPHNNHYLGVMGLSLLATLGAAVALARGAPSLAAGLVSLALLACSKSFIDFSTSGLENPLAHLILLGFLLIWTGKRPGRLRTLLLSSLAALLACTRLDLTLVLLPQMLLLLRQARADRQLWLLGLGLLPLLAWEAFSLVYYGTPLPNTALAKLSDPHLGRALLLHRGYCYLADSLIFDRVTLPAIGLALGAALWTRRRAGQLPLALGVVAYLGYVVWIGGDFMVGRFLSVPLVAAAWIIAHALPWKNRAICASALLVMGLASLSSARSSFTVVADTDQNAHQYEGPKLRYDVGDSRMNNLVQNGLVLRIRSGLLSADVDPVIRSNKRVSVERLGRPAYRLGPWTHTVESHGLTDPLLARMPPINERQTWAGHVTPVIPIGYLDSLRTGKNLVKDKAVAALLDDLWLVTRGPLFGPGRLAAMGRLLLGHHAGLRQRAIEPSN